MLEFFTDGGFPMYPVLIVGLILLASCVSYALDCEPVRLRLIAALSLVLLAFSLEGLLIGAAKVFEVVAGDKVPADIKPLIFMMGMKECTRPLIFGLTFWGLALTFVAAGVYRAGQRELAAAKG